MSHYPYIETVAGEGVIPCCPNQTLPTALDSLLSQYYGQIDSFLPDLLSKAHNKDCFGFHDKACELYDISMDLHYLFGLLLIIYYEREADMNECGQDQGIAYYYDKYKMVCIKKHFKCKGIDIQPLLDVFEMNLLVTYTGIGYMFIEENPSPLCSNSKIFKVT